MRRLLAVALVVALLVGAVPVASVTGAAPARGSPAPGPQAATTPSDALDSTAQSRQLRDPNVTRTLDTTDEFDDVEFHITVYENGTAEWTFSYQQTLDNDSERQQFREFAREFNNESTPMWTDFRAQARELTDAGQNVTGRTMEAQNFRKAAQIDGLVEGNRGVVTMTFQWTSFTYSDNETVIVDDVFEGGLYVGPNQSLVVHAGPQLRFASAEPLDPAVTSAETLVQSGSVTWQGEYDFTDRRPRVTFQPVPGTTTTARETTDGGPTGGGATAETTGEAGTPPAGTTQPAQQPTGTNGWSPLMLFVGAVVVLLGLAAAFAWRQGDFGSLAGDGGNPDGGDAAGAVAGGATGGSTEPAVSDEELLTDEARVKKLLDENGGRMKQVNIVDETGWSKSKVSMLLSEMEDDGEISKLRVGRENIISLEGHEPDAAGSPLEE
ncbi:helix-turn-helix transcriptional regulator [Halorussus halobius]|uniref:helix-turn-helix transcriptional regulator n=1 Tax=Halorussus halobius TaxID=1710537 RepID=UPI00109291E3|nr:hypothetical protein [Halorussus halobius]